MLPVIVKDDNIERAIRHFKRQYQRGGLAKDLRRRKYYMKPSEIKQKRKAESRRRLEKNLRKILFKQGY